MSVAEAAPVAVRRPRLRVPGKLAVGLGIVGAYLVAGALAGVISPYDPTTQDLLNRTADPSTAHLLGTDALGRDVLSRIIHAIRVDLRVGILAALLPMLIGTALGALAGYYGGLLDKLVMRAVDLVQSFPVLVFLLALVGVIGPGSGWWFFTPGELPVVLVFACVGWIVYARLIRAEVMRVKALDYVAAARAGGLGDTRILARHVLPNALNQTIVYVVLDVGLAVLALATLSYLGLGVQTPTPEWGAMISDARPFLDQQWWLVVAPGLAIALLGTGLALIGDALDDSLKAR